MNSEEKFLVWVAEGIFSIDAQGRIWRHKRFYRGPKGSLSLVSIKKRRAEMYTGKGGYLFVLVGKNKKVMAHRVVWTYFNGRIPDGKEMNHLDGIKDNNHPKNLDVVTRSENMKHAFRMGFIPFLSGNRGENHLGAKLTMFEVKRIRAIYKSGLLSMSELARMFSVFPSTIKRIVTNKIWVDV